MKEVRLVRDEEMSLCAELANSVFRKEGQKAMEAAFPCLYVKGFNQSFGVFEAGRLVSFLGLIPNIIRIGESRLKVHSVGSVCTHPDARGNGYASQLFALAKEHAEASGASLLLISGGRSLYTRAGCYSFGSMKRVALKENTRPKSGVKTAGEIREWKPTDWFNLHTIADSRKVRYDQSIGDLSEFIKSEAVGRRNIMRFKVLISELPDGTVGAFAVIAVPKEKSNQSSSYAVEWGGRADLTAELFMYAVKAYHLEELEVPVNWHETDLEQQLADYPYTHSSNSGTVYIVNEQRLFDQLDMQLQCEIQPNGETNISGSSFREINLNQEELVSLLFDPKATVIADHPTKKALSVHLLTPFPYTGGLNYF